MTKLTSTVLVIFTLFCAFATTIAGTPDSKCYRVHGTIKIDGKSDDWQTDGGAFFEKEKSVLFASNDSVFLYLLLRTNDIESVRTIKVSGLTLYVDPKGGKKQDFFSLFFRGGPSMELLRHVQPKTERQLDRKRGERGGDRHHPMGMEEAAQSDSVPDRTVLTCKIEDWLLNKQLSLDGAFGPTAAFDTSQGFYTYEFRIPLADATPQYYGIGAKPGDKVSVGAKWGDASEQRDERPDMDFEFGMPGGPQGMGGMGGGPTSGGRIAPEMRMREKPQKREIWAKAVLAAFSK